MYEYEGSRATGAWTTCDSVHVSLSDVRVRSTLRNGVAGWQPRVAANLAPRSGSTKWQLDVMAPMAGATPEADSTPVCGAHCEL